LDKEYLWLALDQKRETNQLLFPPIEDLELNPAFLVFLLTTDTIDDGTRNELIFTLSGARFVDTRWRDRYPNAEALVHDRSPELWRIDFARRAKGLQQLEVSRYDSHVKAMHSLTGPEIASRAEKEADWQFRLCAIAVLGARRDETLLARAFLSSCSDDPNPRVRKLSKAALYENERRSREGHPCEWPAGPDLNPR
jgi:hypothetical protein